MSTCRLTFLLALFFFLRMACFLAKMGKVLARLNSFTNLANGVKPPLSL